MKNSYFLLVVMFLALKITAQNKTEENGRGYVNLSWKKVATQMPDEWYKSTDALKVAETVLYCQQDIGGWAKNKPYHHPMTSKDSADVKKMKGGIGATIDNGATTTEMFFLAKMYTATSDVRYFQSFSKAFNYLLLAQYPNGGWPQFYPYRIGSSVSYASHITYNDNAMVNVLNVLRDIADQHAPYTYMPITAEMRIKARSAFEKGIDCILKSQIKSNNRLTVWCAQHNEFSLEPANARAYELASYSGQESVGIIYLLMAINNPSKEIISSVNAAMEWLAEHKITGIRIVNKPNTNGKKNLVLVEDNDAPSLLARFYDLKTGEPFFCDRDGIKKTSFMAIGEERRNGYNWYSDGFDELQNKYQKWLLQRSENIIK